MNIVLQWLLAIPVLTLMLLCYLVAAGAMYETIGRRNLPRILVLVLALYIACFTMWLVPFHWLRHLRESRN